MEKDKKTDRMNDAFRTMSESEAAYGFSIWLGAVVFFFLFLGTKPFSELAHGKHRIRNVLVGYGLHLAFAAGFMYLIYWFEMKNNP